MILWSQGCSELVKLLHGCDEVWQPCEGIDNVAARLQWDCEYTTRLWQGCGKVVTSLWIDNVAARLQ